VSVRTCYFDGLLMRGNWGSDEDWIGNHWVGRNWGSKHWWELGEHRPECGWERNHSSKRWMSIEGSRQPREFREGTGGVVDHTGPNLSLGYSTTNNYPVSTAIGL